MNVEELARALISFHTESPAGNEESCAKFLSDYIHDLHLDGFSAELHRFESQRANLIVRIGVENAPGLLLSGHLDTVPVGELAKWSTDPFGGYVKDGLIFGRGAADMKSGVASLVKSLESLKGEKLSRKLVVVATAGEENGYIGLRHLIEDKKITSNECKWGVIAEPTELKVVRKHKGVTRFRISLQGKNAHSSKPELGVNALENASRFIEEIKVYRRKLAEEIDQELGATVLPVTLIEGGVKGRYNVIPDRCEFFINCRRIPIHTMERISKDLTLIADELSVSDNDFKAKIDIDFNSDALQIPPETQIVRLTEAIVGQKSVAAPYGTEAPMYSKFGIPTVVLGPGSVEQAHIVDEFVSLREIEKAVSVYEKLIRAVCL